MTDATHTPKLPLDHIAGEEDVWDADGGYFCGVDDPDNAAIIARAVNSHDDLVKALELAADTIRGYDGGDPEHETGWANDELCVAWVACRDALQKARS